jgi:DNA-binding transcriptional LysR family regulator
MIGWLDPKHKLQFLTDIHKHQLMLDVPALVVMREVARHGSFGKAAKALAYTPPAVSQRIGALERQCGVRLFDRSARGVSPTPAGRLLLEHAERVLQAVDAARADLNAAAEFRRGRIRVGAFGTALAGLVPDALRELRTRVDVDLDIVEDDPYRLLPRVAARELDLAVVFRYVGLPASINDDGYAEVDESRLRFVPLGDEPLLVVVSRDHRLGKRRRVRPVELRGEVFIPVCPLLATFPGVERHLGFRPEFAAVTSDDYHAIMGLVAAGIGIAMIPRMAVTHTSRDDIVALPLVGRAVVRRLAVALPANGLVPPITQQLLDVLVDAAGRLLEPGARHITNLRQ